MGGKLSLVAEFPDRAPVVLSGIAEEVRPKNLQVEKPRAEFSDGWVMAQRFATAKSAGGGRSGQVSRTPRIA